MSHRTCCACLLVGALLGVGVWTTWPAPRGYARTQSGADQRFTFQGAASCSSTACHGGSGPCDDLRSSYTNWMAHDRHAQAHQVLFSERSRMMVKNYRRLADQWDAHPDKDLTCLKCHSMSAEQALAGNCIAVEDGVGCERCHGPAQAWLTEHYTPAWHHFSPADKAALGSRNTKDLRARAQLCVECHVGGPGQDVDHDLIAAGHPRLNFEHAAFLATMPPHWSVRKERCRYPDLEARLWLIGQAVSAESALELLAYRAQTEEKPWPEFAEYECSACHHNLRAETWWQKQAGKGPPGLLPWNNWYYALPRLLSSADASPAWPDIGASLTQLGGTMSQPLPDRKTTAVEARKLADLLRHHLQSLEWEKTSTAPALRQLFERIARSEQKDLVDSWDGATQRYLALAALHQAMADIDPAGQKPGECDALKALAKTLRFPLGYDSPVGFDPAAVRQRLRALQP